MSLLLFRASEFHPNPLSGESSKVSPSIVALGKPHPYLNEMKELQTAERKLLENVQIP